LFSAYQFLRADRLVSPRRYSKSSLIRDIVIKRT
jgi:hypothetical protein